MVSKDVVIPCGIALVTYVFIGLWARRRRLPTPPGPSFKEIDPKALATQPWKVFHQWSLKYGPLISWTMFGKTTVVINSAKVVQDLLEARSSIYSDRPLNIMTGVLAGRKDIVFSISSQQPRFKMYRRLMNGGLSPKVALDYRSIQLEELYRFMRAIERTPEKFKQEVKRNACAVIMKVTYGYELGGYEDEFVKIIEDGFDLFVKLQAPGRWWVEFFPWLRFVPAWFPGAYFKKFALESGRTLRRVDEKPYKWARAQIDSGKHIESFISKQLEEETPYIPKELKEDVLKWVSAALYAGGADTTVSAFTTLFYVMQLHPEVQKKAQQEIESVTGSHRLPTFDDYDSLPYVRAVIKEILRWGTVAPFGLPHSVIQDDVYEGFLIPKGSKIISNIWAIVHDPELYPEPFEFDPERHLGENPQPDPFKYVWGFGRRTCPGAHLAQMSLFINISNVLAVFDISRAVDADGKQVEPPQLWTTSVTSHLEGFPCQIKVRSPDLLATIP